MGARSISRSHPFRLAQGTSATTGPFGPPSDQQDRADGSYQPGGFPASIARSCSANCSDALTGSTPSGSTAASDDRVIFRSVSDDSSLRLRGRSTNGNEGDAPADGCRKADQGVARGVAESTLDAGDLRLLNGCPCRELTLREGCCGAHGGEVAAERYLCVDLCG